MIRSREYRIARPGDLVSASKTASSSCRDLPACPPSSAHSGGDRMIRFSSLPVRVYLLLMVLIVVIPCTLITLYSTFGMWNHELDAARRDAFQMTHSAASLQSQVVDSAHQLLATLSWFGEVREFRIDPVGKLFATLREHNPHYQNISLADMTGEVRASAVPVFTQNVSHRKYFKDAVTTGGFVIGEFVRSEYAKQSVIHFAHPVYDARGALSGVLAIAFTLGHYGTLFSEMRLPENSALSITDWQGTRLYRYPNPERYEGNPDVPDIKERMAGPENEGTFIATGIDGVSRLYGFSRVSRGGGDPYLFIRVGIPLRVIFARVKNDLIRNGILLLLVLAVSLGIARILGANIIIARMKRLVDEANELMHGNLNARTGLDYAHGEFGTLARAFDDMAEALERRADERERVNRQLGASLREKEVLLKEVHHRVKNNLQIISSLLNLQARKIRDREALELFRESQNRVRSIALVHEKLYQSPSLDEINFHEYVASLAAALSRSYGLEDGRVTLSVDIPGTQVSLNRAVPCGLIINELISNAYKHAFPGESRGEIRVEFRKTGSEYRLVMRDNGAGFPPDVDWRGTDTLGLDLVNNLVIQLDGSIEMLQNGGTEFIITFHEE
ncbi:MAG: HAMP domain-containing protein [Spirochaetes bacterium]|nr:MAG: HAMP domain-containing protein [Spirochaetota bacterium]